MKKRIDDLENAKAKKATYSEVVKKVVVKEKPTVSDNTKKEVLSQARKIIGISPITDSDLDYISSKGINKEQALEESVKDFIRYELKINDD